MIKKLTRNFSKFQETEQPLGVFKRVWRHRYPILTVSMALMYPLYSPKLWETHKKCEDFLVRKLAERLKKDTFISNTGEKLLENLLTDIIKTDSVAENGILFAKDVTNKRRVNETVTRLIEKIVEEKSLQDQVQSFSKDLVVDTLDRKDVQHDIKQLVIRLL